MIMRPHDHWLQPARASRTAGSAVGARRRLTLPARPAGGGGAALSEA